MSIYDRSPAGRQKSKLGFTIIELLVVVAIIGLLTSVISFTINTSRVKARDTRRVTDLKQIKSGLDLYFQNGTGYPDTPVWNAAVGTQLSCSGTQLLQVPRDPLTPTNDYVYTAGGNSYAGCGATVRGSYEIEFYIENKALYYIMDEDGNLRDRATGSPVPFDALL